MERQSLLMEASDPKLMTRKWNIVNDNSRANYHLGNEITYNTEVLKPNLCEYNSGYNLVRCDITVIGAPETQVVFEN